MLNLKRLQGLSVLAFHPLKYISFFTSPWEPLLTELDGRLSWEGKKWLAKEDELSKIKRRKKHLVYQFTANLTRLPAILHWHVRFPKGVMDYWSILPWWLEIDRLISDRAQPLTYTLGVAVMSIISYKLGVGIYSNIKTTDYYHTQPTSVRS